MTMRWARGVSRAATDRARPALRSVALRTLERLSEGSVLTTEYPIASCSRYGWDERPAHGRIEEVLAQGRDDHHRTLESFEAHLPELRAIGRRPSGRAPGWDNDWFAGLTPEERRVGTAWVSTWRTRWSPDSSKK